METGRIIAWIARTATAPVSVHGRWLIIGRVGLHWGWLIFGTSALWRGITHVRWSLAIASGRQCSLSGDLATQDFGLSVGLAVGGALALACNVVSLKRPGLDDQGPDAPRVPPPPAPPA